MVKMGNDVRCKLFKGAGTHIDADEQFNEWMDEMTKEHDVTIYQINSTQSEHERHMIFVYYTADIKVIEQIPLTRKMMSMECR